jgi:uncharacterized protein YjiS (DUF1127 family)
MRQVVMRQVIENCGLPLPTQPAPTWLGRINAWLFATRDRQKAAALHTVSGHLLRDIGLLDDRRGNALLRDETMFRR